LAKEILRSREENAPELKKGQRHSGGGPASRVKRGAISVVVESTREKKGRGGQEKKGKKEGMTKVTP